jgi:hypothetical protein
MESFRAKVFGVAIAVVILMGLFPPWSVTGGVGSNYPGVVFNVGYHSIFTAPLMGEISLGRLMVQWAIVAVTAGAIIYFRSSVQVFASVSRNCMGRGVSRASEIWRKRQPR